MLKLAVRNVRRSIRDYAVYFITLTFGVCLFYTFNSLDSQSVVQFLMQSDSQMVESIFLLVKVFSVFVTAVLAGLILYADRFLMKRRKRELGTYFLLGMETSRVARLLAAERLLIGLCALLSGCVLGVLAAWGLDKLTQAMFLAVPGEVFSFTVSWGAVGKTALYFGAIFLLVALFGGVSVSRARLIDLIRSERENEEIAQRPVALGLALFLLGLVSLGTAYAILLIRGLLRIDLLWFIMLGLGTLGTYLLFRSLSGFLLRLTKGHKGYYKGLNMFVLRQWSGKVHTNCLSNTIISILILLAVGVTACCVGLNDTITASVDGATPYDVTLLNYGREGVYEEADTQALFRAAGVEPEEYFARVESVTVYYNDPAVTGMTEEEFYDAGFYAIISLSRYNELMTARGLAGLGGAEGGVPAPEPIVNGPAAGGIAVMEDSLTAGLEPRRQMVNIDYKGDAMEVDALVREAVDSPDFSAGLDIQGNYRLDNYYDLMGSKILVLYMGLYLGVVFLVTAAAVLALQQLSQASDNAQRYQLLSKLGADRRVRRGAMIRQVGLAFALPLALGLIHAAVGMMAANEVISVVGKVDSVHASVLTALFLLVIYGGYFLFTCLGAWRAVEARA